MYQEFGKRLKEKILESNYTNIELTEMLALSKNSITNYINGTIPKASILYELSKLLDTDIEYLLTGISKTNINNDLVELYEKLSEKNKRRALMELRHILERQEFDN